MGKLNTDQQRSQALERIQCLKIEEKKLSNLTYSEISGAFYQELRDYFSLCGMARGKSKYKISAEKRLFGTRVIIEKSIRSSVKNTLATNPELKTDLFKQKFFGGSRKQGVSVRLPLSSCEPTKACANLCYAHDVLDAAPAAVIRGALNGLICELFESSPLEFQIYIEKYWAKWIDAAISISFDEAAVAGFKRKPRIRFGHVGDCAPFYALFNALAGEVKKRSNGRVQSVIYTRHSLANKLDPDLFVINFTLDPTSVDRAKFAPIGSRIVYSAFGGETSDIAEVNFLEHHRFEHFKQIGNGYVCPATHPDTQVRTCDALKCEKCFVNP